MLHIVSQDIEKYCEAHTIAESSLLKELVKETQINTTLPQMQVGHLEGSFLRLLTRMIRAERVLEIGTFTGYSSLMMAEGLPENGELITCDIDPIATEIAKRFWSKSPHGKKIRLLMGPALKTLKEVSEPFDLVFIDADKGNYIAYWELCVPIVRSGGLLVVDNVLWSGKVLDPKEESDHAICQFNTHAAKDSRTECVMVPVRDGILLAWKK